MASPVVSGKLHRTASTTEFCPFGDEKEVEYFLASDASAVIEHTNRVIFMEDDDVAAVEDGRKFKVFMKNTSIVNFRINHTSHET